MVHHHEWSVELPSMLETSPSAFTIGFAEPPRVTRGQSVNAVPNGFRSEDHLENLYDLT